MLDRARDSALVAKYHKDALDNYGGEKGCELIDTPAIEVLINRGEYASTMGTIPIWMRPILQRLPWFQKGKEAVQNLSGLAIAGVSHRLTTPNDRPDFLTRLIEGRDQNGNPLTKEELTSEASSQLTPGSETTSK